MTLLRLLPAVAVVLSACSAEPTGLDQPGSPFQFSFADPVGDTLPPPANSRHRAHDVRGIDVGLTEDSIFVRVEFTGPIARWSAMTRNSIDGFIDFDFDDDASTGYAAATQEFGAVDAQMGVESYVSLRDDGHGHLRQRDGWATEWRYVDVSFEERSLTVRLSRADVGETDGAFRVSAMIGGHNRRISDLVPGKGHHRVARR